MSAHGIVAAFGHSDADYDTTKTAIAHGMRHFTHLFNAMNPIHHRRPGPIIAALEAFRRGENITVEIINDGIHLHPSVVQWAFNSFARGADTRELTSEAAIRATAGVVKADEAGSVESGVVLVTDSMSAATLGDGAYSLGGMDVEVSAGKAVLAGTDTIAGSTLTLERSVQRARDLGIPQTLIHQASWENPLRLISASPSIGQR